MHADKQKMPPRLLHTCLVFSLHLEGQMLCCFIQRKSDRWTLNIVSFLGANSKGLGSSREPESCRAQKHRCHSSQHLSSHHLAGGLDEDNSHHLTAEIIQLPQPQRCTKILCCIYYLPLDLSYEIGRVFCREQFKYEPNSLRSTVSPIHYRW